MGLEKGMYERAGGGFQSQRRFGLRRFRPDRFLPNASWYNNAGERLGVGDLSVADMQRISFELEPGELFVILMGMGGAQFGVHKSTAPEAPGDVYVAQNAAWVIAPRRIMEIVEVEPRDKTQFKVKGALVYEQISRENALAMIIQGDLENVEFF